MKPPRDHMCVSSCQWKWRHTEAAMRISDTTIMMFTALGWDCVGKWMAFTLQEGRTDNALYDTKHDAVVTVSNHHRYLFVKLWPGGMGLCQAEIMLQSARSTVLRGFNLADPESRTGGRSLILPIAREQLSEQIRALMRRKV